jgi:hypothetical protein
MLFISTKAETSEQFLFGRGTMNGLLLIKDWFLTEINSSLSRFTTTKESEVDNSSTATFNNLN